MKQIEQNKIKVKFLFKWVKVHWALSSHLSFIVYPPQPTDYNVKEPCVFPKHPASLTINKKTIYLVANTISFYENILYTHTPASRTPNTPKFLGLEVVI